MWEHIQSGDNKPRRIEGTKRGRRRVPRSARHRATQRGVRISTVMLPWVDADRVPLHVGPRAPAPSETGEQGRAREMGPQPESCRGLGVKQDWPLPAESGEIVAVRNYHTPPLNCDKNKDILKSGLNRDIYRGLHQPCSLTAFGPESVTRSRLFFALHQGMVSLLSQ